MPAPSAPEVDAVPSLRSGAAEGAPPESSPGPSRPSGGPAQASRTQPRPSPVAVVRDEVARLLGLLRTWPWYETLRTLRLRFREDRLGLTASSLTFTTLISLVPLLTVALAVFAAFPMFASFQVALEKYFLQNLVPENIARPVLRTLTQFASQASRLGAAGLVVLAVTALALMMTIDRTLNNIWRVQRPRPFAQRVLVYWAALTLGPLVLGVSLALTASALGSPRGNGAWATMLRLAFDGIEFIMLAAVLAGLYHYVPNTFVRWRHAIGGGVFAAVAFGLAKAGLAWYIEALPMTATVYGAFAALPFLLLWIYLVWLVVLFGAVIAAYAPSLSMRVALRPATPGYRFELALAIIGELQRARAVASHGCTLAELSERLRTDPLQLEPVLDRLVGLDWVARLDEPGEQRCALLIDEERTLVQPLVDALLLAPGAAAQALARTSGLDNVAVKALLGR